MESDSDRLLQLLKTTSTWPTEYSFKFIVLSCHVRELVALFEGAEISVRESEFGKYTSVTVKRIFDSAEDVIERYEAANKLEWIIAL